ncbi:hypothetical protein ACHAWF_008446 [Thalassiosira exigua]
MAAHHPHRNASSFRRVPSPGGGDRPQLTGTPPTLPTMLPVSSDTASSGSGSGSNPSSRSGGHGGGPSASSSSSGVGSSGGNGGRCPRPNPRRKLSARDAQAKALSMKARMENDAMVYLDGPQVYTCGHCRTHLTSHDDIISKSFHGRHGRAYLFDHCVNITTGPPEDRILITGLHSVCDIFCKRCETLVGWTYAKAYEPSQKYKEGKFIVEKINLHLEESEYYTVDPPAGERGDKWRVRSMSWGSERERSLSVGSYGEASPSGGMGSPMGSPGGYFPRSAPHSPKPTRRSPGSAMMSPKSPRNRSDIIYEYPHDDS